MWNAGLSMYWFGPVIRNIDPLTALTANPSTAKGRRPSRRAEDALRDHRVNAFGAVHDLRDQKVHRGARQHVSVLSRQPLAGDEEIQHLARRNPCRLVQIG